MRLHYIAAWLLSNIGIWVKSGGYCWKNGFRYGYYQAYGEFPGCIRTCQKHTLSGFKYHSDRVWRVWNKKEIQEKS